MAFTAAVLETAIETLLNGGQSYRIGDREFTRADLRYLLQARKDADAVERSTSRTIFKRVRFGSVST